MTHDVLTRARDWSDRYWGLRLEYQPTPEPIDALIALAESQAKTLAEIGQTAESWAGQARLCDEARGQQIDDGEAILAILDGNQQ